MSEKIVQLNEEIIKGQFKESVHYSVEISNISGLHAAAGAFIC